MHKLLIGLMVSAGLFSTQSAAFDLGKALEDAAKQKIEEVKSGSGAANTEQSKTPAETESAKGVADSGATIVPDEKAFNWKNPSTAEEIALGREITGSILGAAP